MPKPIRALTRSTAPADARLGSEPTEWPASPSYPRPVRYSILDDARRLSLLVVQDMLFGLEPRDAEEDEVIRYVRACLALGLLANDKPVLVVDKEGGAWRHNVGLHSPDHAIGVLWSSSATLKAHYCAWWIPGVGVYDFLIGNWRRFYGTAEGTA